MGTLYSTQSSAEQYACKCPTIQASVAEKDGIVVSNYCAEE